MVERERNEKDGKFGGIHRSVKEAARERTQARQRAERQTYRQIKTDRLMQTSEDLYAGTSKD